MTRIDFYTNAEPKLQVACQLAAKAVRQSLRVLIYAPDEALARAIDKLLWTFPATGFLPHCMARNALAAETPVLIAGTSAEAAHDQVLLNLALEAPESFSRFQRLIEIVGTEPADQEAGRERYRYYRHRGYEVGHIDLRRTAR